MHLFTHPVLPTGPVVTGMPTGRVSGAGVRLAGPALVAVLLPMLAMQGHGADADPLLDLSLAELGEIKVDSVYAASRYQQKVTDAPASVSVVMHDEIQRFGYRSLGEILKSIRGFDVRNDRSYSYTGVRGYNGTNDYGSRVLLLVDGHRMSDPIYDTTAVGTEGLLDVGLIERVEIVRGPGSAIYGSNAFFGVVNVVTRKGADLDGWETSVTGGTFETYQGRASYGKKLDNGLEVLLSASSFATQGQQNLYYREFNRPETKNGIATGLDGDRFWSMLGKASLGEFTLQGGYVTRDKDVPTASYGSQFGRPLTQFDSRGYTELRYDHQVTDGWSVNGRMHMDHYQYGADLYYENDTPAGSALNRDGATARWWGGELGASRTFFDSLRVSVGTEMRKSTELSMSNNDQSPYANNLDVQADQMVVGAFTDARWEISETVSLSGGARWDHYNSFGNTVNPRAAFIWKPLEDTSFKLLYGEAFRAPNINELNFQATGFVANPNLQPETIRSYEAAVEHYFDQHWLGTVSFFRNEVSALIDTEDQAGFTHYANLGDALLTGVEFEVEGKWNNGMLLRASYTHQNAESTGTGERMINSPQDIAKAKLSVPLLDEKLSAGFELQYASPRLTLAGAETPDALLVNLTLLSKEIRPGLDVAFSVYNLFAEQYTVPGGSEHVQDQIAQDGRTFQVKLTYRF